MAASLLDQNSRSLFHKQRVRAFFSPNFFDTADPAGYAAAASRRLVSGASKDSRAGISRALFCPFRRGARLCPHSQLLRSPSKPVTTITASNPDPIPRYWTIAWFTTTTQHPFESLKGNRHNLRIVHISITFIHSKCMLLNGFEQYRWEPATPQCGPVLTWLSPTPAPRALLRIISPGFLLFYRGIRATPGGKAGKFARSEAFDCQGGVPGCRWIETWGKIVVHVFCL